MNTVKLPTWEEAEAMGPEMTAVGRLVFYHEPANPHRASAIRAFLQEALNEVYRTAYRAGWNDRESDFLVGMERIVGPSAIMDERSPPPGWDDLENAR